MKRYNKEQILGSINILDLAKSLNIGVDRVSSGNFTHRCKCPSSEHKGGSERTGSLCIDGDNNNFYCFGCGASNNVIDFFILVKGCDFSEAITELSVLVDPSKVSGYSNVSKKNNLNILLSISKLFRSAIKRRPNSYEDIEAIMKKTDHYISLIDRYDLKKSRALEKKVKALLEDI